MTYLELLQKARTLNDIAHILGLKPASVSYTLYKIPDNKKYNSFEIMKSNGGKRTIYAPTTRLKLLQRRLADLLYICAHEQVISNESQPKLNHGFSRGLSIVTNAKVHAKKRYIFNLDLQDFFPSCNFGRVYGFFVSDSRLNLNPKVARIIAQIACYNGYLPQGSPCSPIISNYLGTILDVKMLGLAKKFKLTYSRYADDLTFSTNALEFPPDIAKQESGSDSAWIVGSLLLAQIQKAGFSVNHTKTHMQVRGSRQSVTGLTVNKKANIKSEYYRTVRAMCHNLFQNGEYYVQKSNKSKSDFDEDGEDQVKVTDKNILHGRLEHIYHVKSQVDTRDWRWNYKNKGYAPPYAAYEMYKKFLFFKYFVALDRPLIVPEGKTDTVYLRSAISQRYTLYPNLGGLGDNGFSYKVGFMNYTTRIRDILELGDGSDRLKNLILMYAEKLRHFGYCPLCFPVIILVDNDDGAKEIFSVAKKYVSDIGFESTYQFYHLYANLYLVKTPEGGEGSKSCIEDFLPSWVLSRKVDGKNFDRSKKHGDSTRIGKEVFARKVVAANKESIDFSDYDGIMSRIEAVIKDYSEK